MKTVVVDTSALVRLFVPDGPLPRGLKEAFESALRGDAVLLVPELGLAEFTQVLLKKEQVGYLKPSETDEIMDDFLELPLETVRHHHILTDSLALTRKYSLTVYDAIFLCLTSKKNAELITADEALLSAYIQLTAGLSPPA